MRTFTELQKSPNRRPFLITFVLIVLIIAYTLGSKGFFRHEYLPGTLIPLGSLLLFGSITYVMLVRDLIIHVDQTEVRFHIKPFGQWQAIPWSDIDQVYVREYALLGEYPKGVSGVRQGPNGWVYSAGGTYGLQIIKKSGGKILLGTQRPDELREYLASLSNLTTM